MYAKVIFGEHSKSESNDSFLNASSEILVNIDCPVRILYDFIRSNLNIDCKLEFDLCDELGNLVFLYEKEPWTNGVNHLAPKTTYFVVLFERNEDNQFFNPVLHVPENFRKSNNYFAEMITKIKRQIYPSFNDKQGKISKSRLNTSSHLK